MTYCCSPLASSAHLSGQKLLTFHVIYQYTPQTRWWPHDHTRRTHYATVPAHPSLRHGVQRLALPASRSGRAAPAPLPLSSRLELRGTSTGLHSTLFVTLPTLYGSADTFCQLLHRKLHAPAGGVFVIRAFRVQWRWHTTPTIAATTGASSSMQVMAVGGLFA
jgi:hypothetical protein